jgi:hypothetical protein
MAMRRTIRRFGPGVISMRAYGKTSEVNNVTMIVQGAFLTGRLRLIDTACPEAVEGKEREPQVNKSKVSRTANCGCPISNDKARAGPHEREPHPHTHPYCPQKRWLDRFSRSSHQAVCWQVHITILPSIERETAVKWNGFMLCRSLFSPFPNSGHVVRDRKSKDFVEFDRLDRQRERFRRRSRSSRRWPPGSFRNGAMYGRPTRGARNWLSCSLLTTGRLFPPLDPRSASTPIVDGGAEVGMAGPAVVSRICRSRVSR